MISTKKGYSLLVAILIIGSALSIVVITSLLRGTNANLITTTNGIKHKSSAFSDACSEFALMYLRNDKNFTGTDTEVFLTGTCEYTIINDGGSNRTIQVTSNIDNTVRREIIKVTDLTPEIGVREKYPVDSF